MGLRIRGWGVAVPDRVVTNEELCQTLDTSDEWIFERTGIRERRVGGSAGSLGLLAGQRALADAEVTADSVEFVLLATTTPDQLIPATAPTIARDLGITAAALDVNAACSGFMYALRVAEGLVATGTNRALIIGAEHLSRWTDWEDRTMAVLLGDGAGAAVIDATSDDGDLLGFDLGSDGNLADLLTCPHGGTIWMDGREVFRRAVRIMVDSAERAMAQAKVTADELALVVPHQANVRIIDAACQRLGVEKARSVVVIDRYGNTSSASIPLAVQAAREEDRLHDGDLVLLTGFGAGMTWASAVLRWSM
jgi:3-oxoacyl-[acyl-carrier-protein] synthase III